MVVVTAAGLCSTAQARLTRPTLPVKASPNSVASFPCPRNPIATVDIEACEGHKQLKLDREFNRLTAVLWPLLDKLGRRSFVKAHQAWLVYSGGECNARSREIVGGTGAGVVFAECETEMTKARVTELAETVDFYCGGRVRTGAYRKCPHS